MMNYIFDQNSHATFKLLVSVVNQFYHDHIHMVGCHVFQDQEAPLPFFALLFSPQVSHIFFNIQFPNLNSAR
jgi:hypothetical protein